MGSYFLIDKLRIIIEISSIGPNGGNIGPGYNDKNDQDSTLGAWSKHVDGAVGLLIEPGLILEKYSSLSYKGEAVFEYLPKVEKQVQKIHPGQSWKPANSLGYLNGPLLPTSTGNLTLTKGEFGVGIAWNFRPPYMSGACGAQGWCFEVDFAADQFYSGTESGPRGVAMWPQSWQKLQESAEVGISVVALQSDEEKAFLTKNPTYAAAALPLTTGELNLASVIGLARLAVYSTGTGAQKVPPHWEPVLLAVPAGLSGFIGSVPLSIDPQSPQVKLIKGVSL